jgi:hypothetical protein
VNDSELWIAPDVIQHSHDIIAGSASPEHARPKRREGMASPKFREQLLL